MEVESRIIEVTLYARGARVRRVATISLGSAAPRARIVGLPAAVIDETVRIEAEGGAVVSAVHVGLDAPVTCVALRLSTAEPERFGALPELAAQRIGRRQTDAARAGFRAPPVGAAALYQDYLRAFPDGDPTGRRGRPAALTDQVWDEESSRAKQAFVMPPGGPPMQGGRPGPRGRAATAPMPTAPMPPPPSSAPAPPPGAVLASVAFGMEPSGVHAASIVAPAPQRSSARSGLFLGATDAGGSGPPAEGSSPDAYLLGTADQPGGEEITQVTARAIDDRGLVSWSVELPPLGRRAVTLEYRVKSQRGVAGV